MGIRASVDIGGLVFGFWDRCSRRATCICQLENNLEKLEKQREVLMAKRNDVMLRVSNDEGQHMLKMDEVEVWRRHVDASVAEANELLRRREDEIKNLCLGCCSMNCLSSIKYASNVIDRLDGAAALCSKNFDKVAQHRPVAAQVEIPGDQPVGLDTMFDKVWRCLGEQNIGIVGLWGMGGVGKTTLVQQIFKRFSTTRKDLKPIWVVVSKDLNLDNVQKTIGEKLGICKDQQWYEQTPARKAISIFNELRNNEFVLILDDIWKEVNLKEVGVPRPNEQSQSKIIFTSRFKNVCNKMDADEVIEVERLAPEEAWKLFKKNIKEDVLKIPGILHLAKEVERECDRLPLALVTISKATSSKETPEEWRHALGLLRSNASKYEDVEEKVLSILKVSYDYLPNDTARSCFLYCCLFPEDYKIGKDELIEYLICEELIKREDDGIDLRDKGYYEIGNLVRASLLEEEEEGERVRMHDVIRDMALWIARDHEVAGERFLVKTGAQLIKVPRAEEWQGVKRVSLMSNAIREIDVAPVCHNLSTLLLSRNLLDSWHHDFFKYMNALTVLDLSQSFLSEVPSGITQLVSLQSLNLGYSAIRELPHELKELVKLKCLNIEHTMHLVKIPRNLLSSFKLLQILRMIECEYFDSEERGGSQVLAGEVPRLEHLSVLSVTVRDAATLQKLPSCIHALYLRGFRSAAFLDISLLTEMKEITVWGSKSLREFNVSSMRGGEAQARSSMYTSTILRERSFNSLRVAIFSLCDHLLHLTWLILAPNLRILKVLECRSMTDIISAGKLGEIPEADGNRNLFGKLELLQLTHSPNLNSIYWNALPFPSLKNISVLGCPGLKRLPLNSNSAGELVIEGEESWWKNVEWEDEATKSTFLPCFKIDPLSLFRF